MIVSPGTNLTISGGLLLAKRHPRLTAKRVKISPTARPPWLRKCTIAQQPTRLNANGFTLIANQIQEKMHDLQEDLYHKTLLLYASASETEAGSLAY